MGWVRIIFTPPGEAPLEIREAWVGVELPLHEGFPEQPRMLTGFGVITAPQSLLGRLWALLTGGGTRWHGYVVRAMDALEVLEESRPDAAAWWYENTPHLLKPNQLLIFPAEVCEELNEE